MSVDLRNVVAAVGDAEARIKALEAEDGSEDDMVKEFTSVRRGQIVNGGAGRRRRMIVDDADDDDDGGAECEETVIRLDSPESPKKGRPGVAAAATRVKKEGALQTSVQAKSPSPDEENTLNVKGKPVKSEPNSGPGLDSRSKASNRDNAPEVQAQPAAAASVPDAARVGSKRKKVLKTRIDERGREGIVATSCHDEVGAGFENFRLDGVDMCSLTLLHFLVLSDSSI